MTDDKILKEVFEKDFEKIDRSGMKLLTKLIQKAREDERKKFKIFLIDLKHNYNHEGESYKKITEKIEKLKQEIDKNAD